MSTSQNRRNLGTVSNAFFGFGVVMSRFANIPILSQLLAIPTLICYFIGYLTWYVGSFFHKDTTKKPDSWYGFASYKEQSQIASLLGAIAILLCLVAPALIIPTAWLLFASNFVWICGEYHKKNNPPANDPSYHPGKQSILCYYTYLIGAASLVTAMSTTFLFFMPLLAPAVIPITSVIVGLFGIVAIGMLIKYQFGKFEPTKPVAAAPSAAITTTENTTNEPKPPYHGKSPVVSAKSHREESSLGFSTSPEPI